MHAPSSLPCLRAKQSLPVQPAPAVALMRHKLCPARGRLRAEAPQILARMLVDQAVRERRVLLGTPGMNSLLRLGVRHSQARYEQTYISDTLHNDLTPG